MLGKDLHQLYHLGLLQASLLHEHFKTSGVTLSKLTHLSGYLVLLLSEVVGKRAGVLAITPFDIVWDVPSPLKLRGDSRCFVVQLFHPWSRLTFEYDVGPMRWIVAVRDDYRFFSPVGPIRLDLRVEVRGDDVLLAYLTAGNGIDLNALPDSFWVGEEVVWFGQTPSGHRSLLEL